MNTFPPRFLLMVAILFLSACTEERDASAAEEEATVLGQADRHASAKPSLPKVDYWAPLLAGIAGTYDSQCAAESINMTGMTGMTGSEASSPGPIAVTADGDVSSAGVSLNLRRQMNLSLERKHEAGGPVELHLLAASETMMFSLEPKVDGGGWVRLGMMPQIRQCKITRPLPLNRQSLYATFAKLIDANMHVECGSAGALTRVVSRYQLADGILKVAGRVVDLNKLSRETATIYAGNGFMYSANMPDEQPLIIMLDPQGQLSQLHLWSKDGGSIMCSRR
ncbi:hypothetical protein [Massilia sp. CCM 8734]|uniref:hypothetical protein n=1 Tax=Massilia sp. CCM 8734 TaxID=2609283 RepID=UPI0014226ED6|nr:hypothetical protein [Massilia sp. CCM 8734]NHZ96282.1 hypothetical protein [Massilia sp. CCM 8734]